jgi:hypothetical protein
MAGQQWSPRVVPHKGLSDRRKKLMRSVNGRMIVTDRDGKRDRQASAPAFIAATIWLAHREGQNHALGHN